MQLTKAKEQMHYDTGEQTATWNTDFTTGKPSKYYQKRKKNKTQHSCLCDEVRTNFSSYRHVCDFTITPPQMVFQNSFLIRIKNCLSQLLKCFQNNT